VLREKVDRGAADVGVPREPVLPGGAVELLGEGERPGGGGAGGEGVPVGEPAGDGGRRTCGIPSSGSWPRAAAEEEDE